MPVEGVVNATVVAAVPSQSSSPHCSLLVVFVQSLPPWLLVVTITKLRSLVPKPHEDEHTDQLAQYPSQSIGQEYVLHDTVSSDCTSPQFSLSSTVKVRDWTPSPHDAEQLVHADHTPLQDTVVSVGSAVVWAVGGLVVIDADKEDVGNAAGILAVSDVATDRDVDRTVVSAVFVVCARVVSAIVLRTVSTTPLGVLAVEA